MVISSKSISPLARFITGDIEQTPYLTGIKLVELFNEHGSDDAYKYGNFPSRWMYVEQKLEIINGSDNLKAVLEDLIDDRFYIDKEEDLDVAVKYLNDIIKFDGYQAERVGLIYKIISLQLNQNTKASTPKSKGGRPKGATKRTIDRYIKVYHQFIILQKKYSSKKKSELYELCASKDYDGKTYSRKTIKNIIEDKMYNLIPSQ